jgi:hypothetical protein
MSETTERFWPIDEGNDPAPPPDQRLARRRRIVLYLANTSSAVSIVALVAMANVVLDVRADQERPAVTAPVVVAPETDAEAKVDVEAEPEPVTFEPVLIARRERARPRKQRAASSVAAVRTRSGEPPVRALVEALPAVRPAPAPPTPPPAPAPAPAPKRYGHFK